MFRYGNHGPEPGDAGAITSLGVTLNGQILRWRRYARSLVTNVFPKRHPASAFFRLARQPAVPYWRKDIWPFFFKSQEAWRNTALPVTLWASCQVLLQCFMMPSGTPISCQDGIKIMLHYDSRPISHEFRLFHPEPGKKQPSQSVELVRVRKLMAPPVGLEPTT